DVHVGDDVRGHPVRHREVVHDPRDAEELGPAVGDGGLDRGHGSRRSARAAMSSACGALPANAATAARTPWTTARGPRPPGEPSVASRRSSAKNAPPASMLSVMPSVKRKRQSPAASFAASETYGSVRRIPSGLARVPATVVTPPPGATT